MKQTLLPISMTLAVGLLLTLAVGIGLTQERNTEMETSSASLAASTSLLQTAPLNTGREATTVADDVTKQAAQPGDTSAMTVAPLGLLSYQGRLLQGGSPVSAVMTMTFRLYNADTGGAPWWEETQTVQVNGGLFNVMLGTVQPLDGLAESFASQVWLGVQPQGAGAELAPRQPLAAVASSMNVMPGALTVDENGVGGLFGSTFAVSSTQRSAIFGASQSQDGVAGSSGSGTGVQGSSGNGVGVRGTSGSGWGVFARGGIVGTVPDLVLGGTVVNDDGNTWSDPGLSSSDLFFYTNDEFWIHLDEDNSEASSFIVFNGDNFQQFRVDETSGLYGDWTAADTDTIIRTRDNLDIHLDDTNDGINGVLWVRDELDNIVFWVNNAGNAQLDNDMTIQGDLTVVGAKNSVADTSEGMRKLYAVESPENWFEDFGAGQLANGQATVNIDPLFLEAVNTDVGYHVFLTPLGDCNGLYVAAKGSTSFEVRELGAGKATVAFDYRIVAKRRGYEDVRFEPVDPTDYDGQANPAPAVPVDDEQPVPGQSFTPHTPAPVERLGSDGESE